MYMTSKWPFRGAIVWIGDTDKGTYQQVRLIRVLFHGKWYAYLTNELDAERLPVHMAVDLYRQRWRIEDAFLITKSLQVALLGAMGLSYFFSGANNAVSLQVWATWILYAVLVDLTESGRSRPRGPFEGLGHMVAEAQAPLRGRAARSRGWGVARPFADISKVALLGTMEMVFRALPFFVRALHRGETESGPSRPRGPFEGLGHDLLTFLVTHYKLYGLIKRKRSTTPQKEATTTLDR